MDEPFTAETDMFSRVLLAVPPLAVLVACVAETPADITNGRQAYNTYCADCHGADGSGNGPAAAGLGTAPADLTTLTARYGGSYPGTYVMGTIWGEDSPRHWRTMPDFAAIFEGESLVPYDGGDGILTPTPETLVDLAEYLKTLQQ